MFVHKITNDGWTIKIWMNISLFKTGQTINWFLITKFAIQLRIFQIVRRLNHVTRTGIRKQAGGGQYVVQAVIDTGDQAVVAVQAFTDRGSELHFHDSAHGGFSQRPEITVWKRASSAGWKWSRKDRAQRIRAGRPRWLPVVRPEAASESRCRGWRSSE